VDGAFKHSHATNKDICFSAILATQDPGDNVFAIVFETELISIK